MLLRRRRNSSNTQSNIADDMWFVFIRAVLLPGDMLITVTIITLGLSSSHAARSKGRIEVWYCNCSCDATQTRWLDPTLMLSVLVDSDSWFWDSCFALVPKSLVQVRLSTFLLQKKQYKNSVKKWQTCLFLLFQLLVSQNYVVLKLDFVLGYFSPKVLDVTSTLFFQLEFSLL